VAPPAPEAVPTPPPSFGNPIAATPPAPGPQAAPAPASGDGPAAAPPPTPLPATPAADAPPADRNRISYEPPKLSSGDPLAG
jgi:hypothetical protein